MVFLVLAHSAVFHSAEVVIVALLSLLLMWHLLLQSSLLLHPCSCWPSRQSCVWWARQLCTSGRLAQSSCLLKAAVIIRF